ncbi:hypothetical protein SLEP1_g19008 [Rubroshorea leprosula]|nr:hypothetical protein SLEP1_g19008 [Rubroshorea leprosula]
MGKTRSSLAPCPDYYCVRLDSSTNCHDRLHNLQGEGKTMTEYLDHVKMIADELKNIRQLVSDEELSIHVMNSLGLKFREFCTSIRARYGSSQQPTSHSWNKPNKYYNQPRQQFNRRKNGNWRPNNAINFNSQLCNQPGHFANNCPYLHVQAQALMANYASSSGLSHNKWLIDSGANNHITNDLTNLALHSEYDGSEELQIGDGSGLEITHIGEGSSHEGNSASRAKQTGSLPNSRKGKF